MKFWKFPFWKLISWQHCIILSKETLDSLPLQVLEGHFLLVLFEVAWKEMFQSGFVQNCFVSQPAIFLSCFANWMGIGAQTWECEEPRPIPCNVANWMDVLISKQSGSSSLKSVASPVLCNCFQPTGRQLLTLWLRATCMGDGMDWQQAGGNLPC